MASSSTSRREAYLIDKYDNDITGAKLPSNRQALAFFLHLHREEQWTVRDSSTATIAKIEDFWQRARIPMRHKQDCIKKLEDLWSKWEALKKNKSRRNATQIA